MRTDAVAVILEVVARMRQLEPRLKVTWEPGWERLGNGLSARYVGGIVHDTTTPSSAARPFPTQNMLRVGRPDLSGPIANFGGPHCTVDAPWIHVVAAFPANHAGASGGRSMGPLPRTSLFNPTVLGLEIDFSGLVLMPAGQMYVGQLWARAVADVLAGGNLEYVRAHFETSVTGKIDISFGPGRSYDMAVFRRDAAAFTGLQEDDMGLNDKIEFRNPETGALTQVTVAEYLAWTNFYVGKLYSLFAGGPSGVAAEVWKTPVQRAEGNVSALQELADTKTAALRLEGRPVADVDEKALAEGLSAHLAAGMSATLSAFTTKDIADLAQALVDEQDRRARDGDPATGPVS